MDGFDGEAFVAGGHGGDDMGLCSLDGTFSFVAPVELVIRRDDLELNAVGGEVADHGFADDIVADVEGEERRQVGEPGGILIVEFLVFGDVVRVGGAGRHGDDMDHLEPWHYCDEDTVFLVNDACCIGVERAFEVEG